MTLLIAHLTDLPLSLDLFVPVVGEEFPTHSRVAHLRRLHDRNQPILEKKTYKKIKRSYPEIQKCLESFTKKFSNFGWPSNFLVPFKLKLNLMDLIGLQQNTLLRFFIVRI